MILRSANCSVCHTNPSASGNPFPESVASTNDQSSGAVSTSWDVSVVVDSQPERMITNSSEKTKVGLQNLIDMSSVVDWLATASYCILSLNRETFCSALVKIISSALCGDTARRIVHIGHAVFVGVCR